MPTSVDLFPARPAAITLDEQDFLLEADLGVPQRLAVMALRHRTLVRDLPDQAIAGQTLQDRDYAEFLLVFLRREVDDDLSERAILRAFADNGLLRAAPDRDHVTHDCPLCASPVPYTQDRTSVCDACAAQAHCSEGLQVAGCCADAWGDFVVHHVTDENSHDDMCVEVTESGRCWIGERECLLAESRFGGVHVQVL